ncbi:MAG: hypothetical protein MJK12_19245 [Colwellia sp.]|nr:hypothetical protein [Colwellia sp.]
MKKHLRKIIISLFILAYGTSVYINYSEQILLKEQEVYYDYLELCYHITDMKKAKAMAEKLTACSY